jgi:glycosyltransferase involved in cell wall biosynthesis
MNVHMMCPINQTGYGYASSYICKTLEESGHNISLTPIGQIQADNNDDIKIFQKQFQTLPGYDDPVIKIWHQFDLLQKVGRGKYFALPFFEVDRFNQREIYHLNFPDHIIVTSQWAKQVLLNNHIDKPISVIPLGVDLNIFDYTQYNTSQKDDTYIFCSIGKWEKRKAHDTIIECFGKAFNHYDKVELWLVTQNPFLNQEEESYWFNLVDNSPLASKIKVYQRLPNHHAVANVLAHTDCGIYISRGEGWNMELLETMAMNKPVIVSDYSAHKDYVTSDNSYLVDITDTEPAVDNKWFFGQANWAKLGQSQIDQTIEHMRHVYKNNIKTNTNGLLTANNLSWNSCAANLLNIVQS